tara:strand:+ start:338 stop:733 length:396 start_codon:yes stop_codon:yes gene_type:complete
MFRQIENKGQIIAVVVSAQFKKEGIEFFTPSDFSQQLGYMNRPEGYVIAPHVHLEVKRQVNNTQEVLYIKSGKLKVDLYDDDKKFLESLVLQTGDIILLASGGHGFEMLEQTEVIEVKQGPYAGEECKERF